MPRELITRQNGGASGAHRVYRFTVQGLDPGGHYRYRIFDKTGSELRGTRGRFRAVPSAEVGDGSFLVVSCNNPSAYGSKEYASVWTDLAREIDEDESIRLIVHGGDQVYCDEAWDDIADRFRAKFSGWTTPARAWMRSQRPQFLEQYRRFYVDAWKPEPVRRVLRSVPNLMTWDDHEIHDGYGSRNTDAFPWLQEIYGVARQAFSEYQTWLNPDPNLGGIDDNFGFWIDLLGARFIVLDTRSRREVRSRRVLGEMQLQAVGEALAGANGRPVFLVSSTPLFSLLDIGAVAETLVRRFGSILVDASDDYLDGWNTPANQKELGQILDLCRAYKGKLCVLTGDIHLHHALQLKLEGRTDPILHIVSSPLTTAAQGDVGMKLFNRSAAEHSLIPGVVGRLIGMANRRGFAKVTRDSSGIRVRFRLEEEPGGKFQHWPGAAIPV